MAKLCSRAVLALAVVLATAKTMSAGAVSAYEHRAQLRAQLPRNVRDALRDQDDELEVDNLPDSPNDHVFKHSAEIASDVEERVQPPFFPSGSSSSDLTEEERAAHADAFEESPTDLARCILLRGYAEPFLVGEALHSAEGHTSLDFGGEEDEAPDAAVVQAAQNADVVDEDGQDLLLETEAAEAAEQRAIRELRLKKKLRTMRLHAKEKYGSAVVDAVSAAAKAAAASRKHPKANEAGKVEAQVVTLKLSRAPTNSTHGNATKDNSTGAPLPPKDGVVVSPGLTHVDVDHVGLEVNMFAYMEGVAGEVQVVANGAIRKWTSKSKVPLAGFLCLHPKAGGHAPVLHTFPTPCAPTTLSDDGEVQLPGDNRTFDVWIGTTKMSFSSKKKADSFCTKYAEHIARDQEVKVWDAEQLGHHWPSKAADVETPHPAPAPAAPAPAPVVAPAAPVAGPAVVPAPGATPAPAPAPAPAAAPAPTAAPAPAVLMADPKLSSFITATKQRTAKGWTTGKKRLLVVVMDWKRGDSSLSPYTSQTKTPSHYRDVVFTQVAQRFKEMSWGQFELEVTVIPEVVRFSRERIRYKSQGYPFPGLYNGARQSVAGGRLGDKYNFDDYDLAFVITPQQAPVGTKGVAWVGAKGAMCNGCEAISDAFQTMVAVHELGHNLGLMHASSHALEYGNPFDWMGNYPDVKGLSYGLGYKHRLHWLQAESLFRVTDRNLKEVNHVVDLEGFDMSKQKPSGGENSFFGVVLELKKNSRDIYIAFRQSTDSKHHGVFVTFQDKLRPDSELMDAGCHSPSQQDAALQAGYTFLDPSSSVVVKVRKVGSNSATVHVYDLEDKTAVAKIRGRSLFTDGRWKCPRTCQDADWLLSGESCSRLSRDGYCRGGSITFMGQKYDIGKEVCPESCGKCSEVEKGSAMINDGCSDRKIKIDGHTCREVARRGFCSYSTSVGSVEYDLCPKSCNKCPPRPDTYSSVDFKDPTPLNEGGAPVTPAAPAAAPAVAPAPRPKAPVQPKTPVKTPDQSVCKDDESWTDGDGDTCSAYAAAVSRGAMTAAAACAYNGGKAKAHCRKTCSTCTPTRHSCADGTCVSTWKEEFGTCYKCSDWTRYCKHDWFKADCPQTCGTCKGPKDDDLPPPAAAPTDEKCGDPECVPRWKESYDGKCYACSDFATYCSYEWFATSCPGTCGKCSAGKKVAASCTNVFSDSTCQRFKGYGWCKTDGFAKSRCSKTCGSCPQAIEESATHSAAWTSGASLVVLALAMMMHWEH